ncbi:hypothetical protein N431DRAFT_525780, partial [Stipitochalara longipes BDJ]
DYRSVLSSQSQKVRYDRFRNFTVPEFDYRCKALLRLVKVARLEAPKQLKDNDWSQATVAMHLFWKAMQEHRKQILQRAGLKLGGQWTGPEEYVRIDLLAISVGRAGLSLDNTEALSEELDTYLARDYEFDIDPFGFSPTVESCEAGCMCEKCLARNHSQAWTRISLPALEKSTIERLLRPSIDSTRLVEVVVPVKVSFWLILELAAGHSRNPIRWTTFSIFMDDVLGFRANATYFDCTFKPRFAKRVLVGKGKGNNISSWMWGGAITFRKPAKGLLDGCTLIMIFERLGTLFAENGMRVTFERNEFGIDEKTDDCRKVRRTPPPEESDSFEEDEYSGDSTEEVGSLKRKDNNEGSNDIERWDEPEMNQQRAGNRDDSIEMKMNNREHGTPTTTAPEVNFAAPQAQMRFEIQQAESKRK